MILWQYWFLLVGFGVGDVLASVQKLTLDSEQRLRLKICGRTINRLQVKDDRIAQVFGDEGTFSLQAEEHTGQIFIKPTAENGNQPLNLTLITEKEVTQDLVLLPTLKEGATIILSAADKGEDTSSSAAKTTLMDHSNVVITAMEMLMKLVAKDQSLSKGDFALYHHSRNTVQGLQVVLQKTYPLVVGDKRLRGYCFKLSNNTEADLFLQAESFYQAEDLALSLNKQHLLAKGTIYLYVIGTAC